MTWNKHMLQGTLWDRSNRKKGIHPMNLRIKEKMRDWKVTQKEVSQITGIPPIRLSKALNSWYPIPEWLHDELLMIVRRKIDTILNF